MALASTVRNQDPTNLRAAASQYTSAAATCSEAHPSLQERISPPEPVPGAQTAPQTKPSNWLAQPLRQSGKGWRCERPWQQLPQPICNWQLVAVYKGADENRRVRCALGRARHNVDQCWKVSAWVATPGHRKRQTHLPCRRTADSGFLETGIEAGR